MDNRLENHRKLIDYSSMNPKERLDFCRGEWDNAEHTQRNLGLSKLFEVLYGEEENVRSFEES